MKLEILLSCMFQQDESIIKNSAITGNVLVVNQCDREGERLFSTERGKARWIDSKSRGLTVSRNLALDRATGDVCLLCDDDEVFCPDYEAKILNAYQKLPQADVIVFKMVNMPTAFPDKIMRLRFPGTLRVSSWQISFRPARLRETGVRFDELLGAGTGNGAEEELKFLTDCERVGLNIYYVPEEIASVAQTQSTWFEGFNETFFYNRGATTRYILGYPLATAYALYYVLRKRGLYRDRITSGAALKAIFRGMHDNKITKQAACRRKQPGK